MAFSPTILTAVLVDEDPLARNLLRHLLAQETGLRIVGEAGSVPDALRLCQRLPDVLFLDVPPGQDMLALVADLPVLPHLVFVTSLGQHAVRAFELGAVDYLLKPVRLERLQLALERLRRGAAVPVPRPASGVTVIPVERSYVIVPTGSILSLRADGNYSYVTLSGARELYVYRTLSQWETHLPADLFLRLDRSRLINTAHIESISVASREHATLCLTGMEAPLELGRSALKTLRNWIDQKENWSAKTF